MKGGVNDETTGSWTAATRRQLERRLPWENLLPDRQPFYVGSWVYVFGVVTIAALAWVVLHLWGQYFMASWREGRAPTWMIGVVTFAISIVAAFTGYLAQQNFAAQWIAMNAKDAINGTGVGGFFNVLNFGQMYGLHVMLLTIAIIALVFLHIVQVRMKGVVPPIGHAPESPVMLNLRK